MTRPSATDLLETLDATWPAARVLEHGPWHIREGLGGGQRVSAATATPEASDDAIPLAEDAMRDLGQHPLFMIRDSDSALDTWLAARGYDIVDPVTIYLAETETLMTDVPASLATPSWPPLAIQLEIWGGGGIGPGRIAVMERAQGPKTSFLGRAGDVPGGTGFIAMHDRLAMLHALEVVPSERRKGIGRTILAAAANWARARGADWMALAVTSANEAANPLYQSAGMTEAAKYHYRRAPGAAT